MIDTKDPEAIKVAENADNFENADFYDWQDKETFTFTEPQEAIEDQIDMLTVRAVGAEAEIRRLGDITIHAYRRMVVPTGPRGWSESIASHLVDAVQDYWTDDEYSNPDEGLDDEVTKELQQGFTALLDKMLTKQEVWSCEKVAERTYTVDEVLAMMREDHPSWFKEGA